VPGVRVAFKSLAGRPGYVFVPADTVTSDSMGVARVAVTFGLFAGTDQLAASAGDVVTPALVPVTIRPGPPVLVFTMPTSIRLLAAGDSATFQVWVQDGYLNPITNAALDIQLSDSTLLSITPPSASNANATVRALKVGGPAAISIATGGKSTTLGVTVKPLQTNCGGVATPQTIPWGVPVTVTDSVICFAPSPNASGYVLMVFNESSDGGTSLSTTVAGSNVALDRVSRSRIATRPSLARVPTLARRPSSGPKLDLRFHQRLLSQSRSLRRLFGPARAARSFARGGTVGRIRGPSYALSGSAPSVPAVDSLIALNVAFDPCTNADMRTFRVEAVGTKAIVLADTANPRGGFTREDYQRFAARFDTLVYPLDVGNFDVPSDIDNNGRVAILFTKAVNEKTPPNSDTFIGGFFHPRDLFPRTQSPTFAVCPTSNEGEMFYMMVPDPTGAVNGNQFRLGFVDTLTTSILAHEFQHLINAGRRMYVNTSATDFEETWLNEGLSHEAEELLFFRESGYSPRSGLTSQSILDSYPHFAAWVSDDASNFVNFYYFLTDPASHSPIDTVDALETRGATWAFLRYTVDKGFPSDAGVWQRFTNSTTTGLGTLAFALQRDPKLALKDFALANMSGWGGHPSWNFGDVFTQVFVGINSYPLRVGSLQNGTPVSVAVRGGSAAYYTFSVTPDEQGLLRLGSVGAPPDANLKFVLIRQ